MTFGTGIHHLRHCVAPAAVARLGAGPHSPTAEAGVLNTLQSGFESRWGHEVTPPGETRTRAHAGGGSARRAAAGGGQVGRVRIPVGARPPRMTPSPPRSPRRWPGYTDGPSEVSDGPSDVSRIRRWRRC